MGQFNEVMFLELLPFSLFPFRGFHGDKDIDKDKERDRNIESDIDKTETERERKR